MIKRFYKTVSIAPAENAFAILLDGRPVKTTKGAPLHVPTQAFAEALAKEWRAQDTEILPHTMKLTRLAIAAIDGAADHAAIAAEVAAYAKSDLLCYRAEGPDVLVIRQSRAWTPILDWLEQTHGAKLKHTTGVGYIEQPPEALAALSAHTAALAPLPLVALHTLTAITGSLALGLAVLSRHLTATEAFALSRIDETFQAEKWGTDAEAEQRAQNLLADLNAAEQALKLSIS